MRRRKRKIEVEKHEFSGGFEYLAYLPGSEQYVLICAKRMRPYELRKLFYNLSKEPRTLVGLDGKEIDGWRFHVVRYGHDRIFQEDPRFELLGFGPDWERFTVSFQKPELSVKAIYLALIPREG